MTSPLGGEGGGCEKVTLGDKGEGGGSQMVMSQKTLYTKGEDLKINLKSPLSGLLSNFYIFVHPSQK